uniref:Uncharacterized protein n=1 Tax=Octopus bimaculoides TaxID=37653 RepID=A0A0L8IHV2_OCTBM
MRTIEHIVIAMYSLLEVTNVHLGRIYYVLMRIFQSLLLFLLTLILKRRGEAIYESINF